MVLFSHELILTEMASRPPSWLTTCNAPTYLTLLPFASMCEHCLRRMCEKALSNTKRNVLKLEILSISTQVHRM